MPANSKLVAFLRQDQVFSIPQTTLVGMLAAHGWSEREIYEAFAEQYRTVSGIDVPRRSGARAGAREAFFYLLLFGTLATWTIGFASLAFSLIDWRIPDPLFNGYAQAYERASMASSLAALLVAFPLFLLISRSVTKEAQQQPERLESPIRKWLTYMALVVAAGIFMGDLITAVSYLLRGELTTRFLFKFSIVLLLSAGVFFHYIGGLRKTEALPATRRWDHWMAAASAVAVTVLVVFGFFQLGRPSVQREIRADKQRVTQIYQTSTEISTYWTQHGGQLPQDIQQLQSDSVKALSVEGNFQYLAEKGSSYQLCARFAQPSDQLKNTPDSARWAHAAGRHCFTFDARNRTQPVSPPFALVD